MTDTTQNDEPTTPELSDAQYREADEAWMWYADEAKFHVHDAVQEQFIEGYLAALKKHLTPQPPTREQIAAEVKRVTHVFGGPALDKFKDEPPIRKHYAIADAVLALFSQPSPSITFAPSCGFDTEAYAAAHNDGWDAAVTQELQDHPAAFVAALRAAADRIEQDEQPSPTTPSAEPEVDVCLYCHGSGYHDGGDMRDDEPCSACRGTGLAEPPRIEDMAPGTMLCDYCDGRGFESDGDSFAPAMGRCGKCHGTGRMPASIEDMQPGTRFTEAKEWTVRRDAAGFIYALREGVSRFPEDFDPSTIRGVTPPPALPEAEAGGSGQ